MKAVEDPNMQCLLQGIKHKFVTFEKVLIDKTVCHMMLFLIHSYHLCYQLRMKNRKGEPQDFISHLSIYPNVIVRMSAQPLMESLESLMRLSSSSITLHYDTVFNMGDFYLSTLLFRHSVFKGQPVVPFAFLVHTRRFIDDHVRFMEALSQSFPCLASKKFIIVTNREFDFSSVFPLAHDEG